MTDNELTIRTEFDSYENATHTIEVNVFEGADWIGSFSVAFRSMQPSDNAFVADWDSVDATAGEFAENEPERGLIEKVATQLNEIYFETFKTANASAAEI